MNVYGVVVLVTLLLDFLLGLVASTLNLRAMSDAPPEDLAHVYDAEDYRKSQAYTRTRTRFGRLSGLFDLAVLLTFWALDGFDLLDQAVRGLGFGPIATGLLFIGAISLGGSLLSLPFSLYSTFVIEERFGFNRTTPKTFVLDLIKNLALSVLLGAPILALVLYFFESAGAWAWIACWLVVVAFSLVFVYIYPTWIMPLFNRFEPLEEGSLRDALASYAESVGFGLSGIFVVDGSRRSSHGNAFFTGLGRNKRIGFYDTLLEKHSEEELVSILAHEVGHYKKRHVFEGLALSVVHTGLLFFLLSIFLGHEGLFEAFGMTETSVYAGLLFFGLLFAPIDLLISIAFHSRMRHNEFEADQFATETAPAPLAMVSALEKLSKDNLTNLTPHPFYVWLRHSHPPVAQRIRAIRDQVAAA